MSLLHRQIAAQMRLHPKRGGMPLEVVTGPLGILVSAVAGEMASKPLQASVGAVFFMTTAEAIERGRPTNAGIQSLAKDILNQLVYENPALLHQRIADLNANEEKYKDSGFKPDGAYLSAKAKLIETSKTVDERAASLPPEKVVAEYTYSDSFFAFKDQWDAYYERVQSGGLTSTELAGNEVAKTIDDFDAQYRQYHTKFKGLGYVPSIEPPEKSKVGDTFPNLDLPKIVADVGSALKPILYAGLAVGAGLVVLSVYRPGSGRAESSR